MYSHKKTISRVKKIVKQKLKKESTGHGYWHSQRVSKLAKKIAKTEGGDLRIIELAAWLHDIAVSKGRKHHHTLGVKQAEKIIQDADNLDALGAIIIPRIFAHCGHHNIPIYDPTIKPNEKTYLRTGRSTTGINHFHEKLFKIEKTFNTKTAKAISKGRIKFLKSFLKQYLAEFEAKK